MPGSLFVYYWKNADIAEIAIQTTQNTHENTIVSSKVETLSGEVHNVQDRLGQMDLNLQMVMENFIDPATYKHFLILDGQKLEADVAFTKIYGMAKKSILIIDNYVGVKTLDLLRSVEQRRRQQDYNHHANRASGDVPPDSGGIE